MIRGLLAVGLLSGLICAAAPRRVDHTAHFRESRYAAHRQRAGVGVREGDRSLDAAVMISCDLVVISQELSQAVIEATRQRLPDFDLKKMFLNATHTHTGPTTSHGVYDIHVLRIGDAAVCTSRFELFNDFGVQIKARSKAVQTFVVQLAGEDGYLPTQARYKAAATAQSFSAMWSVRRAGRYSSIGR